MEDRRSPSSTSKIKFDPTINLGNIFAIIGCVLSVVFAWSTMDKRVTLVEAFKATQELRNKARDEQIQHQDQIFRETVRDIDRKLEKITDKMSEIPRVKGL